MRGTCQGCNCLVPLYSWAGEFPGMVKRHAEVSRENRACKGTDAPPVEAKVKGAA